MRTWYLHKAEQCRRLAAESTDATLRAKYEAEGILWRKMAGDTVKQERCGGTLH